MRHFQNCHGLTSVLIPVSANVTLTTDMTTFAFSMCGGIKSFVVAGSNEQLSSKNGVIYDKAGTTLIAYPQKHMNFQSAVMSL